ncbi:DUF5825 family protein [Solwaraspora sp. WMMD406]|uniref:DUF5825 family protein n=1 Tax=Solwaraspora sp. WMMD406 TaxID=3016095 RepID=UPI0024163679|nr:DUF5825 family protein [Solwaraspora sp. WMMD406]MDG4765938.1 DUF5825 family protein [Solwaraspora sp. WMMD406]
MTTATTPIDRLDLPAWSLRTVTLPEPLEFGESPEQDLAQLRFLREVTSHAVRLRWTLRGRPLFPLETHVHLVAPSDAADQRSRAYAAEWGLAYRYGSFYYRRGPSLVVVKDVRPGVEQSRMVITDGFDAFLRLAGDLPAGGLSTSGPVTGDAEAAAVAVEAGLAVAAGDAVLILPYRMRHWPVPYVAV